MPSGREQASREGSSHRRWQTRITTAALVQARPERNRSKGHGDGSTTGPVNELALTRSQEASGKNHSLARQRASQVRISTNRALYAAAHPVTLIIFALAQPRALGRKVSDEVPCRCADSYS